MSVMTNAINDGVQTATITLTTGQIVNCYKNGHVVTFALSASPSGSAASADGTIGTIPTDFIPKTNGFMTVSDSGTGEIVNRFSFRTDGTIGNIKAVPSGYYYVGTLTVIV